MEVTLNPDLSTKLSRMATEQGRSEQALAEEAVERFLDHEVWFAAEVDKGIAEAERGEFIDDDAIRALIDRRYPG